MLYRGIFFRTANSLLILLILQLKIRITLAAVHTAAAAQVNDCRTAGDT